MIVDLTVPASTADELSRRDELAERLRWLVTLRWVALASVAIAVAAARLFGLLNSVWPQAAVAGSMLFLNIGFYGIHLRAPVRTYRALSAEALLQISVDVIGLGMLIFFSGGLMNPFIFYFCFHVVIAAILLEKQPAYGVALLTAGIIFLLGMADESGLNAAWSLQGEMAGVKLTTLSRLGRVFALGTTLIIAVYMVTEIMERLRARTQDVRHLNSILNERLDMLASAERKLAAEHQRARAILECMDEGVVVVDLQGQVLLANTAAQHSALMALDDTLKKAGLTHDHHHDHGHSHGEDLDCNHQHKPLNEQPDECPAGNPGKCLQEALEKGGKLCAATLALLGADPPKEDACARLVAPKSPTLAEIEVKGRRFENTVSSVRASGDTLGLVIVSRDVTERRSLERQVVHAEKLHALGNLAAGVAHELNTPLGTILGYAQMLLDDPNPKTELKAIEGQARRCKQIVQGLLDFARTPPNPHSGNKIIDASGRVQEDCAPNELATKVRDLIAHSLKMRDIVLELDLCEPAPPPLRVAANEFEQVLVNLVTNAADAIEMAAAGAGHAPGERKVTIHTRHANGTVTLAVEDTGPGVPANLAEQIFEPFFTTKAAGRGTGLGLSIARRIVEDHEGRLIVTRRGDGKSGARFEVSLQAVKQEANV